MYSSSVPFFKVLALLKPLRQHLLTGLFVLSVGGLALPTTVKAAAEIEVMMSGATASYPPVAIIDDTLATPIQFGKTTPGATITRTFMVKNTGNEDLIVSALETGLLQFNNTTNNTGFSLNGTFPTTFVATGKEFTFAIQFNPAAVTPSALSTGGMSMTVISFSTNDSDESPFNFTVQAQVVDPATSELHVWKGTNDEVITGTATEISTGASSSAGNAMSFGSTVKGKPVSKTITLTNAGGADLRIEPPIAVSNNNGTQPFTVDAFGNPSTVTALIGAIAFDLTMTATHAGQFTAAGADKPETVSFNYRETGSSSVKTFSFEVEGVVGPVPDIAVLDGSNNVVNYTGEIDFGTQIVSSSGITKAITVKNEGGADLILENPISLTGEKFSLSSSEFTTTTLTSGKLTSFIVEFDTTTAGNFNGSVTLKSNDSDEEPFTFNLKGMVVSSLTEPEIEVWQVLEDGTKQELQDGQTQAVELTVEVGATVSLLVFEVKNTGGVDLSLNNLAFNDSQFQLTMPFPKKITAGSSSIFGIQLKNTNTAGTYTSSNQIFNTDGDSGDGVAENPFNFEIKVTVGKETGGEVDSCFETKGGIFMEQECLAATELFSSAVDNTGKAVLTTASVIGGISKANGTYLKESVVTLSDQIAARGVIKVDEKDRGKKVDLIVAGIHYSDQYANGFMWYMLDGCTTCIKIWPYDVRDAQLLLSELRPLSTVTALDNYTVVDIYSGKFVYPGFLDLFFGYRVNEGTEVGKIVFNVLPIKVTIKP